MRISNKTGKWNPSMTEEHNEGHIQHNPHIPKNIYIKWRNSDSQRKMLDETRDELQSLWISNTQFDSGAFDQKLAISDICIPLTYYRKISGGEWAAIEGKANPFKAAFEYTNTALYRYWISSSLKKVKKFGNENATDTNAIIIKLTFSQDLRRLAGFVIRAHQAGGVQHSAATIALHREGFAQIGNVEDSQIGAIIERNLDHNLGFTSSHIEALKNSFAAMTRVQ